jgi:hypothetical protein
LKHDGRVSVFSSLSLKNEDSTGSPFLLYEPSSLRSTSCPAASPPALLEEEVCGATKATGPAAAAGERGCDEEGAKVAASANAGAGGSVSSTALAVRETAANLSAADLTEAVAAKGIGRGGGCCCCCRRCPGCFRLPASSSSSSLSAAALRSASSSAVLASSASSSRWILPS